MAKTTLDDVMAAVVTMGNRVSALESTPKKTAKPEPKPPKNLPATLTFHQAKETSKGKPYIVVKVDADGFRPAYVALFASGE